MSGTHGAPTGTTIRLGQINESFHQVGGGLVHEMLRRLGHAVEVFEGPHPEIYAMLGAGEVHLLATSWLPGGHRAHWEKITDRAVELTSLYKGARFFWAVPDYIPVDEVAAVPDLARADVAERMTTVVVQGTTPGAGLTARSLQLVTEYGLDRAGWSYRIGTFADIIRTVNEGIAAREWFVTPLWQPLYLNEVHPLRPLADPKGVFPAPDHAALTANRAAVERLPARTVTVLRRIHLTIDDMTTMDHAVNVDGLAPLQAAQAWIARHPDPVDDWLT